MTASHYFQVDGKKPMVMKLTTKRCGADEAPSAHHPSTETLLTAPVRIHLLQSASYFQVFQLNCHFCRNLLFTSYFLRPYCAMPPKLPLKRRTIFYNEIFYSKPQSSRCWTARGNDLLLLKINVKSGLGKMIAAGNNQTEN